jgi:uncharacterized protein (TIGR02246 family)
MDITVEEIRAIERRRLQALVDGDIEAAAELHADDYELITPSGVAFSKSGYLGAIGSGQLTYARFEPVSEIRVRLAPDCAVLRYQAAIAFPPGGPAQPGIYWHTDVYQRVDGGWKAVWSQATTIQSES